MAAYLLPVRVLRVLNYLLTFVESFFYKNNIFSLSRYGAKHPINPTHKNNNPKQSDTFILHLFSINRPFLLVVLVYQSLSASISASNKDASLHIRFSLGGIE